MSKKDKSSSKNNAEEVPEVVPDEFKKVNPTLTAKIWYNYICSKYESEINNDNIEFFIEKDYKTDLVYMNQSEQIISSIDKFREPIRNMSKENQEKSFKYVKNLCILSKLYMQ